MSIVKPMTALGLALFLLAPSAHAADTNACSDAYTRAQELRAKRKLLGAREALRLCSQQTCPGFIVKDCTTWLDEVQASLPSVVPVATDAAGNDLGGVRISMDGEMMFESSDGRSVEVDPGKHAFTFELRGASGAVEAPPVIKHVVVAEGEKNKRISAIVQKPGAPLAVAPTAPPQQVQLQPTAPVYPGYPAQVAQQSARPPVAIHAEGNRDDLRLQFDSFETNTHTSCAAPCDAQIPPGNYQVGIARGTGAVRSSQFVFIGGPGTVKATSVTHTGLHVAGILTLIGSVLVQIGLSADALSQNHCTTDEFDNQICDGKTNSSELGAATVIGVLGFTAGIIMIAQKNRSDVSFVPLNAGALVNPREQGLLRLGPAGTTAPQGAAIQIRF